jgi:hypothetical protein
LIDNALATAYDGARALLADYLRAGDDERRACVATLQPSRDDLARIFVADVVDDAAAGYAILWNNRPLWPAEGVARFDVVCARAAHLVARSPMTRELPGGYVAVARHLRPEPIWCGWRFYYGNGALATLFDGLVLVEGSWRWCPRPWRVLPTARRPHAWLWTE